MKGTQPSLTRKTALLSQGHYCENPDFKNNVIDIQWGHVATVFWWTPVNVKGIEAQPVDTSQTGSTTDGLLSDGANDANGCLIYSIPLFLVWLVQVLRTYWILIKSMLKVASWVDGIWGDGEFQSLTAIESWPSQFILLSLRCCSRRRRCAKCSVNWWYRQIQTKHVDIINNHKYI